MNSYLLLGSNLGKREKFLSKTLKLIEHKAGKILKCSSIYETEPWGEIPNSKTQISNKTPNPKLLTTNYELRTTNFLNQVILIETLLTPQQLLFSLLNIEKSLGRKRVIKSTVHSPQSADIYQSRTIDIDILFYDDIILSSEFRVRSSELNLIIPHPLLHERKFALIPLSEIAPDFIHPILKKSIKELLDECKDTLTIRRFED